MLSGCSLWNDTFSFDTEEVARAPLVLATPDKFRPSPIPWYIVTEETANDVFTDLAEKGYDPVIFGLTDKGYENISLNQAKMLKLMIQLSATIEALEDYYIEDTKEGRN